MLYNSIDLNVIHSWSILTADALTIIMIARGYCLYITLQYKKKIVVIHNHNMLVELAPPKPVVSNSNLLYRSNCHRNWMERSTRVAVAHRAKFKMCYFGRRTWIWNLLFYWLENVGTRGAWKVWDHSHHTVHIEFNLSRTAEHLYSRKTEMVSFRFGTHTVTTVHSY